MLKIYLLFKKKFVDFAERLKWLTRFRQHARALDTTGTSTALSTALTFFQSSWSSALTMFDPLSVVAATKHSSDRS